MDLHFTGDRAFNRCSVCTRGRHHLPVTASRDALLTTIGGGIREVRLLVIARQCRVA